MFYLYAHYLYSMEVKDIITANIKIQTRKAGKKTWNSQKKICDGIIFVIKSKVAGYEQRLMKSSDE